MKEHLNEAIQPNQIRIRITGSETLRVSDASYIKYTLIYNPEDPKAVFQGYYYKNETEPRDFLHTFAAKDFDKVWKDLKDRQIEIQLVRQKWFLFFYKTALDSQNIKLTPLGTKSTIVAEKNLEGAKITCEVTLHKAIRQKEMDRVTIMKKVLGPAFR